jgi:hypothetical protein
VLKTIFVFVLLFAVAAQAEEKQILSGCRIYDKSGNLIRNFPGAECIFSEKGFLLTRGDKKTLLLAPPFGKLIWSESTTRYDSMALGKSGKIILLQRPPIPFFFTPGYHEVISIFNPKGSLLGRFWSIYFGKSHTKTPLSSISEIPDQKYRGVFLKGDIIVNTEGDRLKVFSGDLTRVKFTWIKEKAHRVHDAQVDEMGRIFYLTRTSAKDGALVYEEYDPKSGRVVYRFPNTPVKSFSIPVGGGVSKNGDHIVITHPLAGTYIISRKQSRLINFLPHTHYDAEGHWAAKQSRFENFSEVITKWH